MKPVFYADPVNGPFDDPSLYVRILRESRALLFDAGDMRRLETGSILKISDIFITHTHMDHFIGFDSILRAVLRREEPLRIFGPENIISCVEGKLRGYSWNLIREYPVRIEVFELRTDSVEHAGFYAENSFCRIDGPSRKFDEIILEETFFRVRALHVTHEIPVLAYSLEEEFHININKDMLQGMGLPVGPWLSEMKKAIRRQARYPGCAPITNPLWRARYKRNEGGTVTESEIDDKVVFCRPENPEKFYMVESRVEKTALGRFTVISVNISYGWMIC